MIYWFDNCLIKSKRFELNVFIQCLFPRNICLDEDVQKTSFVFVFRRRLQDVLIITNIFALTIHLQETYQDVFKTFSRRLQDVLEKRLQDKKSSRRLQDLLQRYPQDIFKTYHQVKLFLLTVFEKYCKDSYLQNDLSRSHF